MPVRERRRFESRFLASESRRKRVEFARALTHLLAETRVTERLGRSAPLPDPGARRWRRSLRGVKSGRPDCADGSDPAHPGGRRLVDHQTLTLRSQLTRLQAQQQSQQNDRDTLQRQVEMERRRSEEQPRNSTRKSNNERRLTNRCGD